MERLDTLTALPARHDDVVGARLRDVLASDYPRLLADVGAVAGDRGEAEARLRHAIVRAVADGHGFTTAEDPGVWLREAALSHRPAHRPGHRHGHRGAGPGRPGAGPPDLTSLVRRGRRLRTLHEVAGALLTATVLVVVSVAALVLRPPAATPPPVPQDPLGAHPWPGDSTPAPLPPGTYRISPSPYAAVPSATLTVGTGWSGWMGPVAGLPPYGDVGVLVLDVDHVATQPCRPFATGMAAVPDDPAALVAAFRDLPRVGVEVVAASDHRFGYPATHLRLAAGPGLSCAFGQPFELVDTARGLVSLAADHGAEVWVVDVHGRALVVMATYADATPPGARHDLDDVVASVRLWPTAG